jgi:hypothetical protein
MEKGNIMATTKESMKVIAGGLDKKEEPEVVMEGKVIAVEVPDELAEAFERLIGGMITRCEDKDNLHPEDNQNDNADMEDEDRELTEVQELVMDMAFMLGSRASDHLMMIKEKNDLSTEAMLAITRCLLAADSDYLVTILETIFLSNRMYDAAHELHLLERCKEYEADAAFFFEDAFWDTDAMDWYSIENLLREKAKEQNSKLN